MGKLWKSVVQCYELHRARASGQMPFGTSEFCVVSGSWQLLFQCERFLGMWLKGIWPRSTVGHWPSDALFQFVRPEVRKKAVPGQPGGDARHLAAFETALFAQLMPVVEHCGIIRYEDGDPRRCGWVTMGTLGAAWSLTVKDPDSALSFRIVDASLDKAWEAVALLLACDQAPWTPDEFLERQAGRKGKK